jgi:hypothetical protein
MKEGDPDKVPSDEEWSNEEMPKPNEAPSPPSQEEVEGVEAEEPEPPEPQDGSVDHDEVVGPDEDEGPEEEPEPEEDIEDEPPASGEKEPRGRGMAKTALYLGIGAMAVFVIYFVLDLIDVFANNIAFLACFTGLGLCLLGLIGLVIMLGAIIFGIVALVQGAGDRKKTAIVGIVLGCLLYTSPSPRDRQKSRMPSSA